MESWSVGYDGNEDVERHAGVDGTLTPSASADTPLPLTGEGLGVRALRLRVVSDYI